MDFQSVIYSPRLNEGGGSGYPPYKECAIAAVRHSGSGGWKNFELVAEEKLRSSSIASVTWSEKGITGHIRAHWHCSTCFAKFEELVMRLMDNGWEPQETIGQPWYNVSFMLRETK
jgi:hypothetical protein